MRWVAVAIVATSLSTLHAAQWQSMTGAYYNLTLSRPCRDRILPAILARPFVDGAGIAYEDAWWCIDVVAVVALLAGLRRLLGGLVGPRWAEAATWAAPAVLAMSYLPRHTFAVHAPYDFPALAFIAWALCLGMSGRWAAFVAVVAVGALNRETIVAAPLCVALARPEAWRWCGAALVAALGVKVGIPLALPKVGGGVVSLTWNPALGGEPRIVVNAREVLASPSCLLAAAGWLPLAWVGLWGDIPAPLRRWWAVSAAMVAGYMVVGNIGEARLLGEPALLLYVPAVAGVSHWLTLTPQRSFGCRC